MSTNRQEIDTIYDFLCYAEMSKPQLLKYQKRLERGGYITVESLRGITRADLQELKFNKLPAQRFFAAIVRYFHNGALLKQLEQFPEHRYYATGSSMVDELFVLADQLGLPSHHIIEVWGKAGYGKSQLCLTTLMKALQQGEGDVIYVDTDNTLSLQRINQLAIYWQVTDQLHRFRWSRIDNLDELELLLDDVTKCIPEVLVIDNIATPMLNSYQVTRENLYNFKPRNERVLTIFSRLRALAFRGALVLYTNQVEEHIGSPFEPDLMKYGTYAFEHQPDISIHLKKGSKVDHKWFDYRKHKNLGLVPITAEITKARNYAPGRGFAILSPFGFSDPRDIKQLETMTEEVAKGCWFDKIGQQYPSKDLSELITLHRHREYEQVDRFDD